MSRRNTPHVPRRSRRGLALVVSVMVLAVLTAAAIALSSSARLELRAARRGVDQLRRDAALRGAVNRGVALLDQGRQDPETLLATLRDYEELNWQAPGAEEPSSDADEGRMLIGIQLLDASGRLNLNTCSREQLQKLPGIGEEVAGAIVEWRTESDEKPDSAGTRDRPYEIKQRPFDTVEELLLVPDLPADAFFGAPTIRATRDARGPAASEFLAAFSGEQNVDAEGNARIDLNRAEAAELLAAANRDGAVLDEAKVRKIVEQRDKSRQQYPSVGDALRAAEVEERFWGTLLDRWTVDPRSFVPGRVNVNTAPAEVLRALPGMTDEGVEKLMEQRGEKAEGLGWENLLSLPSARPSDTSGERRKERSGGAAQQSSGLGELERAVSIRSSVYLVRCLVRESGSERVDASAALVLWPGSPDDPVRIVQWRRPDRFPGWSAWFRPASVASGAGRTQGARRGSRSTR